MLPQALTALRPKARALFGTAEDLLRGALRPRFREALAAELGLAPQLLTTLIPWIVRTRSGADASLLKQALENAETRPHGLAIEMDDEKLTWSGLASRTSRYAHVLTGLGVRRGDVVALFGNNSPSYLALILACSRVGATAALINSRIEGQPLAHAILASKARVAIVETDLEPRVRARADVMERLAHLVTFRTGSLEEAAERASSRPFERVRVPADSDFVYIYTSGTTGLPKPCRVTHAKSVLIGALVAKAVWEWEEGDKLYVVMPLYHSSGLLLGFGGTVMARTPIALRESFSARAFWSDVRRYNATGMLYIGELCRYLLNSPESPDEKHNSLRVAMGNGLRADLWEPFSQRFGITNIREFYGATEAPGALFNLTGRVGSVGRMPARRLTPLKIIRYDVHTDTHPRGQDGLCVECGPGEVGELVVVLKDNPISALGEFRGYTDEDATNRKILRDVLTKGDRAFRSGDLLRFDEDDYFYFVDRIGDTFRFKGENVSTAEVAEIMGRVPGIKHVAVVGIALPRIEGRAGLAAVQCDEFDPSLFWKAAQELPDYAQPRIVRRVTTLDTTATFKIQKTKLEQEALTADDGNTWVRLEGRYQPLTRDLWARIEVGDVRIG